MRRSFGALKQRTLAATLVVAMAGGALALSGLDPLPAAAAPPETATTGPAADDAADRRADPADPEPEEPQPTPEELAHERALEALATALRELQAADAAHRAAVGASNRADGALRSGEETVVDVVLDHLVAEEAVRGAQRRLQSTERQVRRLDARLAALARRAEAIGGELDLARLQLEERVIRAYKTGSLGYETSLPLTIIREASSPSEFATAVKQLATLMSVGLEQVDDLVAELETNVAETAAAETQHAAAVEARDVARAALAEAEEGREGAGRAVSSGESRAEALRSQAYAAEAQLLAAVGRVHERLTALVEARAAAEAAAQQADVSPPPPAEATTRPAAGREDDEDDELAGGTWNGRERALARARSLPGEDRHAAPDWVCPVEDGRFINDWGFPRSDNRRHEGTDVFAPIGTPVLAPVDAVVAELDPVDRYAGRRDLGGITVTLELDRHRYYFAHLDGIAPELRAGDEVAAGDVIGWVGRTGNARGTPPHLHYGWYVDRVAVNPYASLAVACSSTRPPLPTEEEDARLGKASWRIPT